jgi:hypothetical protein
MIKKKAKKENNRRLKRLTGLMNLCQKHQKELECFKKHKLRREMKG